MSIPEAQSVGMTGFQLLCDTASFNYFRDKMAQSIGTTGVEGFSGGYRGPGRQEEGGRGARGAGGRL